MTLIVETGVGVSNAESYASVTQADTRLANLGLTTWADEMEQAEQEQALRRATTYMEQAYRTRWTGTRLLRTQALSWPRYGVCADGYAVESTIVPADIVNACIDLAFKAAAGDLNEDVSRAIKREKVGPLETEYADYGLQSTQYRAIDMVLSPYLTGGGASARLVRT